MKISLEKIRDKLIVPNKITNINDLIDKNNQEFKINVNSESHLITVLYYANQINEVLTRQLIDSLIFSREFNIHAFTTHLLNEQSHFSTTILNEWDTKLLIHLWNTVNQSINEGNSVIIGQLQSDVIKILQNELTKLNDPEFNEYSDYYEILQKQNEKKSTEQIKRINRINLLLSISQS